MARSPMLVNRRRGPGRLSVGPAACPEDEFSPHAHRWVGVSASLEKNSTALRYSSMVGLWTARSVRRFGSGMDLAIIARPFASRAIDHGRRCDGPGSQVALSFSQRPRWQGGWAASPGTFARIWRNGRVRGDRR